MGRPFLLSRLILGHRILHWPGVLILTGTVLAGVGVLLVTAASSAATVTADRILGSYWRTTYDILVRPAGSVTDIERRYGLVRPNHLLETAGGISLEQYQRIREIPGVEVAAPIGVVGYLDKVPPVLMILDPLPEGIYLVEASSVVDDGHRLLGAQARPYYAIYVESIGRWRMVPDRDRYFGMGIGIAGWADVWGFDVWLPNFTDWILLVAIDPEQEALLMHLDEQVISGSYLPYGETTEAVPGAFPILPVLLNRHDYVWSEEHVRLSRLLLPSDQIPSPEELRSLGGVEYLRTRPRVVAWERTLRLREGVRDALTPSMEVRGETERSSSVAFGEFLSDVRLLSRATYRVVADFPSSIGQQEIVLEAVPIGTTGGMQVTAFDQPSGLALQVWDTPLEASFRRRELWREVGFVPQVVGVFDVDPAIALAGASPNQVPLETYYPPLVTLRYDEDGRPVVPPATLRPTLNDEGYLLSPPEAFTTLEAAARLVTEACVEWTLEEGWSLRTQPVSCPPREGLISAIRVRVAGITDIGPAAQARIERVAQEIVEATGLHVDIMVGSSPRRILVRVPGYGDSPGLGYVEELWVQKGVTTNITTGLNLADRLMFGVMLAACSVSLFVAVFASVLGRMGEYGILHAVGWGWRALLRFVLGEAMSLGLLSGIIGVLLGLAGSFLLGKSIAVETAVLFPLITMSLFTAAAILPARSAWRLPPAAAIRRGETAQSRRLLRASSVLGLAAAGMLRRPSRTLATAATTVLAAGMLVFVRLVTLGLDGSLYGTLLGEWVRTEIRPYHEAMVMLALFTSGVAVGQVMALNLRERRGEIGLLRAVGWRRSTLLVVFLFEGTLFGLLGGAVGTALSALLYHLLYDAILLPPEPWIRVVGAGLVVPTVVAALGTLGPAWCAARLFPVVALGREERMAFPARTGRGVLWLALLATAVAGLLVAGAWAFRYWRDSEGIHEGGTSGISQNAPEGEVPPTAEPPPTAGSIPTPTPANLAEMPRYHLELRVDPLQRWIEGEEEIQFANHTGGPLEDIVLRLYPNSPVYDVETGASSQERRLEVTEVQVNQHPAPFTFAAAETALVIPLEGALEAGDQVTIGLTFTLRIGASGDVPPLRLEMLGSFYPMLAVREGTGWRMDLCGFCWGSDGVFSESAFYEFTVTAPADRVVVATGEVAAVVGNPDGSRTTAFQAGPVRDLALAFGPELGVLSRTVNGVRVSVYFPESESRAEEILGTAADALRVFGDLIGPYPYNTLSVVAAPSAGNMGIEYPGVIYLYHWSEGQLPIMLVSHEVAHQWWYGVVGNDVFNEPWLDEALAQYSAILYVETVHGSEEAVRLVNECRAAYQLPRVLEGDDRRVDSPLWAFAPDGDGLFETVYDGGAVFLHELRQVMGTDAFLEGLRRYYTWHQYGRATGAAFRAAMQSATAEDLELFFQEWMTPP